MAKVISKGKPKGKTYDALKSKRKKKRLEEERNMKRRAEFKRQNAEARKEREELRKKKSEAKEVELVKFEKGKIFIKVGDKVEKRVPSMPEMTKENYKKKIGEIEIKILGEMTQIRGMKGFKEVAKVIAFELEVEL